MLLLSFTRSSDGRYNMMGVKIKAHLEEKASGHPCSCAERLNVTWFSQTPLLPNPGPKMLGLEKPREGIWGRVWPLCPIVPHAASWGRACFPLSRAKAGVATEDLSENLISKEFRVHRTDRRFLAALCPEGPAPRAGTLQVLDRGV